MTKKMRGRFFTWKTLIRVVLTTIGLSAMPHAQAADKVPTQQSGNAYNFTAGGGG